MWIPRQPPVRGRCGERRRTLTSGGALCLLAATFGRHRGCACWRIAPSPWLCSSPTRSARPCGPTEGRRPSTRQRIGLRKHSRSRPGKANYAQAQTKIDGIFDPTPVGRTWCPSSRRSVPDLGLRPQRSCPLVLRRPGDGPELRRTGSFLARLARTVRPVPRTGGPDREGRSSISPWRFGYGCRICCSLVILCYAGGLVVFARVVGYSTRMVAAGVPGGSTVGGHRRRRNENFAWVGYLVGRFGGSRLGVLCN
jgi:hypothetical protein